MKLWELIALLQAFQDKNAEVCVVLETSKDHRNCASTIDFDISGPAWRNPKILVRPSDVGVNPQAEVSLDDLSYRFDKLKKQALTLIKDPLLTALLDGAPVLESMDDLKTTLEDETE